MSKFLNILKISNFYHGLGGKKCVHIIIELISRLLKKLKIITLFTKMPIMLNSIFGWNLFSIVWNQKETMLKWKILHSLLANQTITLFISFSKQFRFSIHLLLPKQLIILSAETPILSRPFLWKENKRHASGVRWNTSEFGELCLEPERKIGKMETRWKRNNENMRAPLSLYYARPSKMEVGKRVTRLFMVRSDRFSLQLFR